MQGWRKMEETILQSADLAALRRLRAEVHAVISPADFEKDSAAASEAVNRLHDALIRKALSTADERVRTSLSGVPPVSSFAFLLFGSGGRKEQTLWSDQDNGLVYRMADGAGEAETERYVARLAQCFQQALEEIGYPPCEGKVLATNPKWRLSSGAWVRNIACFLREPDFETVRSLLILADGRCIYGDDRLLSELKKDLLQGIAARKHTILPRMLQNTLRHKLLVGVFRNLLTEPYGPNAGGIDIKYGAYLPMVNAVRLLSLAHNIAVTPTLDRIRALTECGALDAATARAADGAFQIILKLRAMTPSRIVEGKYMTSGVLPAHLLTHKVKSELKTALRTGKLLQRKLKRIFGTEGHF